jgi:anti-sigma regulatory factor (Ser/Thr protein kinase)
VYVERVLLDRCPQALVEAAALLASELVTNAVQHARTSLTLSVSTSRDGVRLEVSDGSTRMPVLRDAPTGNNGRGLVLVDRLAHSWGAEPRPDGKIVWLELTPRGTETAFAEAARS